MYSAAVALGAGDGEGRGNAHNAEAQDDAEKDGGRMKPWQERHGLALV